MILKYYKSKNGNFGDDLNPWLWRKIFPKFDVERNDLEFYGIGTILNETVKSQKSKVIFGSGCGYGNIPNVDNTFQFYGVRGPLTCEQLSIDQSYAISDPALLISIFFPEQKTKKKWKYSFVPHHSNLWFIPWNLICGLLNIHLINPEHNPINVIKEIQNSEIVFCEAMHGAIFSDALRVNWIPIKIALNILEYKWKDYTLSVDIKNFKLNDYSFPKTSGKLGLIKRAINSFLSLKNAKDDYEKKKINSFLCKKEILDSVLDKQKIILKTIAKKNNLEILNII
jgi:succinoglycan biosynthesis protein ExoV